MRVPQPNKPTLREKSTAEIIAKMAFLVYILFVLFGTSMPFQEKVTKVEDIATANLVSQIVYPGLFLVSVLCLMRKGDKVRAVIAREKFLTCFLLWCGVSIFWSWYPFESFKGLFHIVTSVVVILAFILNVEDSREGLVYLRRVLFLYVALNLLAVLMIPGAMEPDDGAWRGLASHKNLLGHAMLVSAIGWVYGMGVGKIGGRLISALMLVASVVLVVGSRSMTAIAVCALLGISGVIVRVERMLRPVGAGKAVWPMVGVAVIGVIASVYWLAPEIIVSAMEQVGRDPTLTGRTELWGDIFEETKRHIVFGSGFGGFWVADSPPLNNLYRYYVWLPRDGHNGYLDILNETGIVGLFLVVAMVGGYFSRLSYLGRSQFLKWFVISGLLGSLTESTLLRGHSVASVMFIFAYLALYADQLYGKKS